MSRVRRLVRDRPTSRLGKVPPWTILLYGSALIIAFWPNVVWVSGIHGDYETLYFKSSGMGMVDQLFAIGRPVAAFIANLTIWPLHSLADFRWARVFSLLTMCLLGLQMLAICIVVFRTRKTDAVVIALAIFLVPPFVYSILQPAAWAPHLVTMLIAQGGYLVLSRSNFQTVPFVILLRQREWWALIRQLRAYVGSRPVWGGFLIYQLSLYDYPPNAMILVLFPVIAVLFSQTPWIHRVLIAVRDICFVGVALAVYSVSAKLIYYPLIRPLVYWNSEAWRRANLGTADATTASNYDYKFNIDVGEILARLGKLTKIAGDIWFLPQTQFYLVTCVTILLAIGAMVLGAAFFTRQRTDMDLCREDTMVADGSLKRWLLEGAITLLAPTACFLAAAVPVLVAGGGFITYRTIPATIAITAVVFTCAVGSLARSLWRLIGSPFRATVLIGDAAMVLVVCGAVGANLYANYATMKLAGNELAYIKDIVRTAAAQKARAIILVDPRPTTLPEENPEIYDHRGWPVPPFELGCLSGYCEQSGAIVRIAAEELGLPRDSFNVLVIRDGKPVSGVTCAMLVAPTPTYPPQASERTIWLVNFYRSQRPFTCEMYGLEWHNLGFAFRK